MTAAEFREWWGQASAGERDAKVAELVMGWWDSGRVSIDPPPSSPVWSGGMRVDEWRPTNDIGHAWRVVEKIITGDRDCLWELSDGGDRWTACISFTNEFRSVIATAPTAPEAICLAACLAMLEGV